MFWSIAYMEMFLIVFGVCRENGLVCFSVCLLLSSRLVVCSDVPIVIICDACFHFDR